MERFRPESRIKRLKNQVEYMVHHEGTGALELSVAASGGFIFERGIDPRGTNFAVRMAQIISASGDLHLEFLLCSLHVRVLSHQAVVV